MAIDYSAKIAALEEAVGSGVLTVESNGERMTYRTMADLLIALNYFTDKQAQFNPSSVEYGSTLVVFGDD